MRTIPKAAWMLVGVQRVSRSEKEEEEVTWYSDREGG